MDAIYILDKLESLMRDKGLSKNALCKRAAVTHNTLQTWRRRKAIPTIPILEALCDELNISVAQLLYDTDMQDLPSEHKNVLELYSTLNRQQKDIIISTMRSFRGIE